MASEDRALFNVRPAGWRALGWSGLVVGAACLGALVAVAALKHAQALSTVALVIALIAFLMQFIVYHAQTQVSHAISVEAARTGTETRAVLEKIEAVSSANQQVLVRQFDALLNVVVNNFNPDAVSAPIPPSAESDIEESPRTSPETPRAEPQVPAAETSSAALLSRYLDQVRRTPRGGGSDEDKRIVAMLKSWPDPKEAKPYIALAKSLSPSDVSLLLRYGDHEVEGRREGKQILLGGSPSKTPLRQHLLEKGLIQQVEPARPGTSGEGMYGLTDQGRQVARLFLASGDPPPEIRDELFT